jgi:FMN phosphatase YigB (HAD superfamily)
VRALLIDLGNVLVRFDHGIAFQMLEQETGVPAERLRAVVLGDLARELDTGRLAPVEFFRAAEARAAISRIPDEVWTAAWRDIFTPIPESLALLDRLADGVASALVSNTNALHWEGVLRVCDVDRRVDALALSFQVGAAKPEARIFDTALERLGAARADAAFADDRPDFVAAARELGIDAFVVDSPATLERELAARGLLAEATPPELRSGLDEFRRGRFFEAHEEWEALWVRSSGDEKLFLQALIQLAAGCVHLERGNRAPGLRLLELAREKLARCPPSLFGIAAAPLAAAIDSAMPVLAEGAPAAALADRLPLPG